MLLFVKSFAGKQSLLYTRYTRSIRTRLFLYIIERYGKEI